MDRAMDHKPLPRITDDTRAFWEGCAAGELRIQRCGNCDAVQFPPRSRCGGCGSDRLDWVSVEPRGEVYSFTVVHRAPITSFRPDVPYVVALVDVAPGARLMLNVSGCDVAQVHIGMAVRIDFETRDGDGESIQIPVAKPG